MKRKTASPSMDARTGKWRLHFSYQGRLYRRYYIDNQRDAELLQEEVNHRIRRLRLGLDRVPSGQSLPDYVFGEVQETSPPLSTTSETILWLLDSYENALIFPIKAKSTIRTEKVHLGHFRRFLAHRREAPDIQEVTRAFFHEYKTWRYAAGVRTDTVRKELSTWQVVFQGAVDNGLVAANVVREVKRDKSQVPCDRFRTHTEIIELVESGNYTMDELKEIRRFQYLTLPEIESLIGLAEGKWLQPILITFAYTGMRRGELLALEWSDVDIEARCIYVQSKKQSRAVATAQRRIPIHPRLLPVLETQRLRTGAGRWVFQNRVGGQLGPGTILVAFRRLIQGTEFDGVGYHVFRHSLASNLAARGVEQHYIDSVLGHQTEAMRRRYQHLFPDKIARALRAIEVL